MINLIYPVNLVFVTRKPSLHKDDLWTSHTESSRSSKRPRPCTFVSISAYGRWGNKLGFVLVSDRTCFIVKCSSLYVILSVPYGRWLKKQTFCFFKLPGLLFGCHIRGAVSRWKSLISSKAESYAVSIIDKIQSFYFI